MKKSQLESRLAKILDSAGISYRREVRLLPPRRWRWDFVVGNIAIEVDGLGVGGKLGGHQTAAGMANSQEKQNAAVTAGYKVLRFGSQTLRDEHYVLETIWRTLGIEESNELPE